MKFSTKYKSRESCDEDQETRTKRWKINKEERMKQRGELYIIDILILYLIIGNLHASTHHFLVAF